MADLEKGGSSAEKKQSDKSAKAKKPSFSARISKWVRELKSEIHKIVWPTRQQTRTNTIVVVTAILVVGVFIWVIDALLNLGLTALINQAA